MISCVSFERIKAFTRIGVIILILYSDNLALFLKKLEKHQPAFWMRVVEATLSTTFTIYYMIFDDKLTLIRSGSAAIFPKLHTAFSIN